MFLLIVTVTSMLLAAIMSAIAWRISGDERRRSDARVAALAAEIHHDPAGRVLLDPPTSLVQAAFARSASARPPELALNLGAS
ncbi:MAG TPA: hypothetical protein VKI43_12770, partial [Vicinamibacterales bacterium]|nr:hypothetical protein [Vicinamibacterales bacterium]